MQMVQMVKSVYTACLAAKLVTQQFMALWRMSVLSLRSWHVMQVIDGLIVNQSWKRVYANKVLARVCLLGNWRKHNDGSEFKDVVDNYAYTMKKIHLTCPGMAKDLKLLFLLCIHLEKNV